MSYYGPSYAFCVYVYVYGYGYDTMPCMDNVDIYPSLHHAMGEKIMKNK